MIKAVEEQSICFFGITYQGKHTGSVLLTKERYTEQLRKANTIFMTKCTGNSKITLTFEKSDGETVYMFHLYNFLRETYVMEMYF